MNARVELGCCRNVPEDGDTMETEKQHPGRAARGGQAASDQQRPTKALKGNSGVAPAPKCSAFLCLRNSSVVFFLEMHSA